MFPSLPNYLSGGSKIEDLRKQRNRKQRNKVKQKTVLLQDYLDG